MLSTPQTQSVGEIGDIEVLVALTILERQFRIGFIGVGSPEIDSFLHAWARCGAHRVTDFPGESHVPLLVAAVRPHYYPTTDDPAVVQGQTFSEVSDRLAGALVRIALTERADDLLLFHAAGLADPASGAVVALVGPSGRGKTTASSVLGADLAYVSDEVVAVRGDLTVVPLEKPLSVKQPAASAWKAQVSPGDLGLLPPPPRLHLRAIVLLQRDPALREHGDAALERISLVEALPQLVLQTSYLASHAAPLRALQSLDDAVGIYRAHYADAPDLAPLFRAFFSANPGRPDRPGEWPRRVRTADQALSVPTAPAGAAEGRGERAFARGPVDDVIDDGVHLIVLRDGTVNVLDGIALAIWAALDEPRSFLELVRRVVAVHGLPSGGDGESHVRSACEALVLAGIIRAVPA